MGLKIAAHLTEKLMFDWPQIYWLELLGKLTKTGHDVYLFSDEPQVQINDSNPKLHNRLHLPDSESEEEIGKCDLFIGFPLKYAEMARRAGVKTVLLLAATNKGSGIKTSVPCGGCIDNVPGQNTCMFGDFLCLWEITPNDVLEVVNG